MSRNITIPFWCLLLLMSLSVSVHASGDSDITTMVQQADVICVGVTGRVEAQQQTLEGVTTDQKTLKAFAVADFRVENTLKGEINASSIHITFPSNKHTFGTNVPVYTQLVPDERVLVFLKTGGAKDSFLLLNPSSAYSPKILLGSDLPVTLPQDNTPFRRVVAILSESLHSPDVRVQNNSLVRLREVSYVFFLPANSFRDYTYADHVKKMLDEPKLPPLEEFAARKILAPIKALLTSSNAEVAANAVLTAAAFQSPEVISKLVLLAKAHVPYSSDAVDALGNYRTLSAIKPLILALEDKNSTIRSGAAHSLRDIGDPLALPALALHLNDMSREVRFWVVGAFATATNSYNWLPTMEAFGQDESRFLLHWRQWVVQHQEELKTLKARPTISFKVFTP